MSSNETVTTASSSSSSPFRFPKRLYAAIFPCSTRGKLSQVVGQYGTVNSVSIPTDDQGRSKGIAFVSFHWREQAVAAMEGFNGTILDNMIFDRQCVFMEKEEEFPT
mmetsp:Transcript_17914/g.48682  ORF Transcript_17914/g.48682 Transcript_17914/m.48682 type:complete len:107 (-) Transcript_17914:93-413(-)